MAESALRRLIPSARDRILSQQGQMPTAPMPQETFRGRAFNTMYDMFGGSSEDPARRAQATRRAESVMGAGRLAADFTPVVGDAIAIDEARDAYRQGNMGQAAILTGLATLGMVPLVGDAAARAARGATSPLEGVVDAPTISSRSKTSLDPNSLSFRESEQNRLEQASELFDSGEEISPIVTIYNNGRRDILDGHNRASIAILRKQNLPAVDIDIAEYERLKKAGFDDMEIAYATLLRADEDDAASAINKQFYGSGISQRGVEALSLMDSPAPASAAPSPLEGTLDMSTDARMQRAAEQGYTDRLRHSSSEVFAGSPQAEEALGFGIPIQNEFKKEYGGTYFAPESALTEEIFSKGPFGGSAEYLINKGNNFNANFRSMNEGQKKELMDVIGSIVDADEVDNAFDVFTDGDFYQTYGRQAQNDLLNAFSRRGYDSVTFPDNLASGDMTSSTVVFNPSNIRSVNAAFDPAMRGSANLLAGAAGATFGLSALRNIQREDEQSQID